MIREIFREKLAQRLGEEYEVPEKIASFDDLVRAFADKIWGRTDEILESQMRGIVNAYIVAVSELILLLVKEVLREMAEKSEVEGKLDESDLRAALISFLGELWDKKISRRVAQIHRMPKSKQDELRAKFIDRFLSRFQEFIS